MYKQDKIGVDVRIDGMTGELSHDIEHAKDRVKLLKEAYENAHETALAAMNASIDAAWELDKAERELKKLESIDEKLRQAKKDVDQAYDAWLEWRKS